MVAAGNLLKYRRLLLIKSASHRHRTKTETRSSRLSTFYRLAHLVTWNFGLYSKTLKMVLNLNLFYSRFPFVAQIQSYK